MSWMAWLVGTMSNTTLRRSASRFTSSITGNWPYAPLPITRRLHFHGISSSMDRGVWPNSSRNLFDGLANFPTVDDEVVLVGGFANAKGAKTEISEVHHSLRPVEIKTYALFL